MLLDFSVLASQWVLVLLMVICPMLFKFVVIAALARFLASAQAPH